MAEISFTSQLRRHVDCPDAAFDAGTLQELLDKYFTRHAAVRHYILDDQGALRHHVVIFVDGEQAQDRVTFSDVLRPDSRVHVFQALSGG